MREEGAPCTCVTHRWCTALPPEAAAALRRRKPLLVRGADPVGGAWILAARTALPPEAAAALRRRKPQPLLVRGADPAGDASILAASARGGLTV